MVAFLREQTRHNPEKIMGLVRVSPKWVTKKISKRPSARGSAVSRGMDVRPCLPTLFPTNMS